MNNSISVAPETADLLKGASNGSSTAAPNGATPATHAAIGEATAAAAERGMPLRAEAMTAKWESRPAHRGVPRLASLHGSSATLLQSEPWNRLPPDILQSVRVVDIMATLAGIQTQMDAVDAEIEHLITTPVKLIADVAAHTLGAGGKRLRPALVILAAQLCGDNVDRADPRVVTCAAAVELIHTTSLLHDDVVDSASSRRGKPAANLVWGNETSILVGDYLFAQVFVTVSRSGFHDLLGPIAHATSQLCAGELLETQTRGLLTMKERQYCDIIALKTAALTECACRLGAMAMGADAESIEKLGRYGREVGMAFQIVDDVFDVIANESGLGKPVGNDIREGDITLPMLRAMQTGSEAQQETLRGIIGVDGISDDDVRTALEIIRSGDAVAHSLGVAAGDLASAKGQLGDFGPSPAHERLTEVADYVLSRDR